MEWEDLERDVAVLLARVLHLLCRQHRQIVDDAVAAIKSAEITWWFRVNRVCVCVCVCVYFFPYRVLEGSMMSSTNPRRAAGNGLENSFTYSSSRCDSSYNSATSDHRVRE